LLIETSSTSLFNGVDIDDSFIIADSQLDYPGREGGWQFMAVDKTGAITPLIGRKDVGSEWTTQDSYLVGADDEYCKLGRDFVHPGYLKFPALVWKAPSSRRVDLLGEFACIRSLPNEAARVTVLVKGVSVWTGAYRFPEILRFRLCLSLDRGDVLSVYVSAEKVIDHQAALYYCWLADAGPILDERLPSKSSEVSQTAVDSEWRHVYDVVGSVLDLPADQAVAHAHKGFDGDVPLPKWPDPWRSANPSAVREFDQLGQPRFFSIRSVADE
jgi:hypothetical protein